MPPYRQDLSKAAGGKLTGRGGREQTLGAAAQRRLASGTRAAAGRPAAPRAPRPAAEVLTAPVPPAPPPMAKPNFADFNFPSPPPGSVPPMFAGRGMASFLRPPVEAGTLPGEMNVGPPAGPLGAAVNETAASMPGGGQVPAMAKPNFGGVNSNAFAANGGTPSGGPLQPGGGQAARLAALLARLRGGGTGLRPQPMMA